MMYFEIDNFGALKEALRRLCAALFADDVPPGTVFDSKVVANELIVNALRHGGGRAFVTAERCGREIKIAVRSENDYRPPEKSVCSDRDAERGRGLFLVDALAARRAYSREEGICAVLLIQDDGEN